MEHRASTFFAFQETNCTTDFLRATYDAPEATRLAVYCLAALQAFAMLAGSVLNATCLATLLRYPLSPEVNANFVSFAISDTAFLLFNLLDTASHCVENSGSQTTGLGPLMYIVYVHPVAWMMRSVAYTVHSWQTVLLSVLKCVSVTWPLAATPESRLNRLTVAVWLYGLATGIPPVLLFRTFVSVFLANCGSRGGYRVASSGYYGYYSSNQTSVFDQSGSTVWPALVAVNSSVLPACICLVCGCVTVLRLRHHRDDHDHHYHHRRHHGKATAVCQSQEATRAVVISVNSFLIFQLPMVMWTMVDIWFWPALQPPTFSLLVAISNTLSQAFFAVDLSACLHNSGRFRANVRRFLSPIGQRLRSNRKRRQQQQQRPRALTDTEQLRSLSGCEYHHHQQQQQQHQSTLLSA